VIKVQRRIFFLFIIFLVTLIFLMYKGFMPNPPRQIPEASNISSEMVINSEAIFEEKVE